MSQLPHNCTHFTCLWLCGSQQMWKILQEMGISDHLTCLLRNLYAGQEATVRTRHGSADWFQIKKGVHQDCILSPCLFNLHAKYIMRNTGLDEAQAGIKIAERNISNLRYADDTTLMTESEELKSLLMKVKEESEKAGLNLNIQKTKIMASGPIPSWQIDEETMVRSLLWEDPTYQGATKPMSHNYWAATTGARMPRTCPPQQEEPPQWEAQLNTTRESPRAATKTHHSQKIM